MQMCAGDPRHLGTGCSGASHISQKNLLCKEVKTVQSSEFFICII